MSENHVIPTGVENERKLKWALGLTGTFLIIEVIGGLWTGSLALLSDAAHMLTDVMALIIALIAIRIGKRAADDRRTYGYKRFEILAAAFNAVVLFLVAFYILYEAYQRFQNPPDIEAGWMMAIAIAGLIINIISMRMLAKSSEHSLNMKGAYLEVLSDMVGSIGVIAAALIIKFTGWWQVDPILAVLIGFWILPRTWKLLSESLNILLEGVPLDVDMKKLQADLMALPGIAEVHDLHVWAITSGSNSVTAHLLITSDAAGVVLMEQAQAVVKANGIEHSNFQVEVTAHSQSAH
jgi:cobalt-zinc-cadmium efflux system protein